MLGAWLLYAVAVALLALVGMFASKGGRKTLRKGRRWFGKRARRISRDAWRARRMSTPRGRMREARRREPHRLTFGHRRPDGDPTSLRRLAGSAFDEMRTAAANRKAERLPLGLRALGWFRGSPADWAPGKCGAETVDSTPCQNRRMIGKNHCRFHPPTMNQMMLGNR